MGEAVRISWRQLAELPTPELPAGPRRALTLLLVDIDRLAVVNHAAGLAAGDELIAAAGRRLAEWAGRNALVARLDGGRYAVLAPQIPAGELPARMASLRHSLAEPVRTPAGALSRSASIGVATATPPAARIADLVLRADEALAVVKRAGGDGFRIWDAGLHAREVRSGRLETQLQHALRTGAGLLLHYQPEFDLCTGRLLAVEALARWRHPQLGLLGAGAFIGLAEDAGMIAHVGEWALRNAVAQRASWAREQRAAPFVLRVNLSPLHLGDTELPRLVATLLVEHGVSGDQLGLEVTESAQAVDPEGALRVLASIKRLGLDIAIDDFGVAHSSFARLRTFPFDALKIDRQFVHGLAGDATNRLIVEAVARLARLIGTSPIAEGVEDHADVTALLRLGCRRAQGNWLMPPAEPDALLDVLRRGRIDPPPAARAPVG